MSFNPFKAFKDLLKSKRTTMGWLKIPILGLPIKWISERLKEWRKGYKVWTLVGAGVVLVGILAIAGLSGLAIVGRSKFRDKYGAQLIDAGNRVFSDVGTTIRHRMDTNRGMLNDVLGHLGPITTVLKMIGLVA